MSLNDFQRVFEDQNPLDTIGKWVDLLMDIPYRVMHIEWKKSCFTTPDGQEKWSAILTLADLGGRLERVWAPSILVKSFIENDIPLSDKTLIVINDGVRKSKENKRIYHSAKYIVMDKEEFEANYSVCPDIDSKYRSTSTHSLKKVRKNYETIFITFN